jgi:hypothetical protein
MSFANVMAFTALMISLGGTTYAAATINGKALKNRSVVGKKIKANSLRGTEILEASLGIVPNASKLARVPASSYLTTSSTVSQATNATNATNASQLGGTPAAGFVKSGQAGSVTTGMLTAPPMVSLTHSAALDFPNSTFHPLPFDTELFDNANMHDPLVNPSRITAPIDGVYRVDAGVGFVAAAGGPRELVIRRIGIERLASQTGNATSAGTFDFHLSASVVVQLDAGEYVEVEGRQTTGAPLAATIGTQGTNRASVTWISPLP